MDIESKKWEIRKFKEKRNLREKTKNWKKTERNERRPKKV